MPRKVFISHKNTEGSNKAALKIQERLATLEFDCFLDKINLQGGMNWNDEIINSLITSDVVIVMLDEETVDSNWVQREIDIAKSKGISILPVSLDKFEKIKSALNRFNMMKEQFVMFDPYEMEKSLDTVAGLIDGLADKTLIQQQEIFDDWLYRQQTQIPKKAIGKKNPNRLIFSHPDADEMRFHIACGDASRIKEFDVLVNTENNYMQMARFYETTTLSYAIRVRGAYFEDEVILIEDTIQEELYKYAKANGGLPVREGRVLVTSAGHPLSDLRKYTNYRYIFHIASVRVNVKERKIEPIPMTDRFIENCIKKIERLQLDQGQVKFGDDETIVPSEETFYPIESILFPVFGAGNGGKPFKQAVNEIVECFHEDVPQLIKRLNLQVHKIGLAIYLENNIEIVKQIFLEEGFELVEEA